MIDSMMIPEGIDTIGFQVNTKYVNKNVWGKTSTPIITLRQAGNENKRFFRVDVQFEALDMSKNLYSQIIDIIFNLYSQGIIELPNECAYFQQRYIQGHLAEIAKLTELDFFFDFQRKDIEKYSIPGNFPDTNYSLDHLHKSPNDNRSADSLWILYDRVKNLKRQRQLTFAAIDTMPYPMRLEIRLNRQNCNYLNFININGSYLDTIYQYRNVIARSWRGHERDLGKPAYTNYHFLFNAILKLAEINPINQPSLFPSDTQFI
jgi:hypothetical protein